MNVLRQKKKIRSFYFVFWQQRERPHISDKIIKLSLLVSLVENIDDASEFVTCLSPACFLIDNIGSYKLLPLQTNLEAFTTIGYPSPNLAVLDADIE